jgi:RNA polymerase sigma-70 factor (ECF subfamily)
MTTHAEPPHAGGPGGVDDPGFVAALKAGDDAAYARLVTEQGGRMLAVARRLLRSDSEAQEAVHEAFISAFRSIQGFAGEARLSTWLHRITVNAALMKLRSKKRHAEEPIEPLLPTFQEDGHQTEPTSEWRETAQHAVEREELKVLVRRCIDRLPESYRTVLLLRDIEELDTEETARVLQVNANVVKIRLHRARQALRTLLDPHLRKSRS